MLTADICNSAFELCIQNYHVEDSVIQDVQNPYEETDIRSLIYLKNWIDTVQWHYEDLIRNPSIDPVEGMKLKRQIDESNQERTDLVEQIDDWFLEQFKEQHYQSNAKVNTESPAWVIDRLSILSLKIFHMNEEVCRSNAEEEHLVNCKTKLNILLEQRVDLSMSLDQLLEDIKQGARRMKVYRQMKMYNDPATNPVLYKS